MRNFLRGLHSALLRILERLGPMAAPVFTTGTILFIFTFLAAKGLLVVFAAANLSPRVILELGPANPLPRFQRFTVGLILMAVNGYFHYRGGRRALAFSLVSTVLSLLGLAWGSVATGGRLDGDGTLRLGVFASLAVVAVVDHRRIVGMSVEGPIGGSLAALGIGATGAPLAATGQAAPAAAAGPWDPLIQTLRAEGGWEDVIDALGSEAPWDTLLGTLEAGGRWEELMAMVERLASSPSLAPSASQEETTRTLQELESLAEQVGKEGSRGRPPPIPTSLVCTACGTLNTLDRIACSACGSPLRPLEGGSS